MSAFIVTVHSDQGVFHYNVFGTDSIAVHIDAIDRHGACKFFVTPRGARP